MLLSLSFNPMMYLQTVEATAVSGWTEPAACIILPTKSSSPKQWLNRGFIPELSGLYDDVMKLVKFRAH